MRFDATIPILALCMAASCVVRTPTLSSSLGASVPAGIPAPPPPSAPPDEEPDAGGIIEAGCTFTGSAIKGGPGSVHVLACPRCDKTDNVFGTDVYTSDTPVCAAAMHAGMISDRGGQVTVVLEPGRPAYRGSKHHGIASRDWGAFHDSFRFQGPRVAADDVEPVRAPIVVDAGCSFEGNQIHGEPGSVHRVSCPPGCKENGWAAGTDTYSGNSRICAAAIHAGLSSDERGGEFTLILGDKRPAFRGSKRNGIESHDWGEYAISFRLQR